MSLQALKEEYPERHITPQALNEKEAALYIGMSVPFLRQSRTDGNRAGRTAAPPWIKAGRSVRYLRSDLDDWLQQNRVCFEVQ